jgi:tRNA nucleotidyltransferase (CCA-adding enzyme)
MEILTTHINADFDGLAAMVAALRLHPEARLFFPGSREESVRRMLESGLVEISELKRKDIDPSLLTRVILCDVRQRDRIGVVAEWLEENPGIEVWAYDHHPPAESDIAVSGGIVDAEAGSTSTVLSEEMERRGIPVSPTEASLLLLGIYEDTGSLTHATTGPRDLQAALRLLGHGGDLALVRRFVTRPLSAQHLDILYRMTHGLEIHRIRGHRVGLVEIDLDDYVEELAPLVSRCLEIFDLPLLFALFSEAASERVTLIARGNVPGLDLGQALAVVAGGGGHATAAAARLKATTVLEARERLLAFLHRSLPPSARARDLMIAPFFELAAATTVDEAKARLNGWRVNAVPVIHDSKVIGVVTRTLLDAAIQHGLGGRPLERVTAPELVWADPEAPAEEVEEKILAGRSRFVLVGDPQAGRPLGLITRMQVLRHLHGRLADFEERFDRRAEQQKEKRQKITQLLERLLPAALKERVETIARVSREAGVPVYIVGGFVRDLLLERDLLREQQDLDLMVEGDGLDFAARLAAALGGRMREHRAFLTAVVVDRDGFHIDVATARSEFYRAPAALPEVRMSALRQDLFRRDFTINTLAVRLGPEPTPELIDYFGGRKDLNDKVLRVLHSLSFIDDPTRVLRAVRLELRLGFRISPETLRLADVALAEGIFEHLSGARLREELERLLDDPGLALRGIDRLAELGVLRVLHPRLELTAAARERLRAARAAADWYLLEGLTEPTLRPWRLMLLALTQDLDAAERVLLADRLLLAGEDRRLLTDFPAHLAAARRALRGAPPHRAAEALEPLAGEELLLLLAEGDDEVRAWVRRDLSELRRLRLEIRGADLIAAGVPPGPGIGRALQAARRARLDGLLQQGDPRQAELDYALSFLRST